MIWNYVEKNTVSEQKRENGGGFSSPFLSDMSSIHTLHLHINYVGGKNSIIRE